MAKKKDFKNITQEEIKDYGGLTRTYFSEETLKKAETKKADIKADEEKQKRKYTKPTRLKTFKKKEKIISIRISDEDYELLLRKAEESESGTITKYIIDLIRGYKVR